MSDYIRRLCVCGGEGDVSIRTDGCSWKFCSEIFGDIGFVVRFVLIFWFWMFDFCWRVWWNDIFGPRFSCNIRTWIKDGNYMDLRKKHVCKIFHTWNTLYQHRLVLYEKPNNFLNTSPEFSSTSKYTKSQKLSVRTQTSYWISSFNPKQRNGFKAWIVSE